MAMDVVEGLNYLHSKEYIHRDIACRNCLVSANRTIKIGDFGMTRRLYDESSYVFTGRGKNTICVQWYLLLSIWSSCLSIVHISVYME